MPQLLTSKGPIVRINPEELHVDDPAFYDQIYVGTSRKTNKWHWSAKMFGWVALFSYNASANCDQHDDRSRRHRGP
jgi:hypothetical protein